MQVILISTGTSINATNVFGICESYQSLVSERASSAAGIALVIR